MKGGNTPIHVQRWCPADYHGDEHVKLLKARRDWATLTFYRHFIDFSFSAGGDLPADPEALAAAVEMPLPVVRKALAFCIGKLIEEAGGRLHQKRVRRDVLTELEFRAEQAERGRLGGRPKKALASDFEKPPLSSSAHKEDAAKSPPSPFASALHQRRPPEASAVALPPPASGRAAAGPVVVLAPPRFPDPPARPPAYSPAERAEQSTTDEIRRLQNTLGTKLAALSEHPNNRGATSGLALTVTQWCRKVTSYTRADGGSASGAADYRTVLRIDRLEKSIADAEWWLAELEKGPIPEKPDKPPAHASGGSGGREVTRGA